MTVPIFSTIQEMVGVHAATVPVMPAAMLVILVLLLFMFLRDVQPHKGGPKCVREDDQGEVSDIMRSLGAHTDDIPHEECSFVPSTGLVLGNPEEAGSFQNNFVNGKFLSMHRATYDRELNKSGEYRYGGYFLGKKRLWEARCSFSFRKDPPLTKDVFFGIELEEYVPMNAATKKMMAILVENLKVAVGKQIYHTPGDDPSTVSGPLERPTFVMPLYAFDQFIVTPPGETPPELNDPAMPSLGSKRVGRVRAYRQEIEDLEFKKGYTYTFNFWGIAQWFDKLNWAVLMPILGTRVGFNTFAGRPPVHVVCYTLKGEHLHDGDPRHLQFKKNYLMDVAFWTSNQRPPKEVVHGLFRGVERKFKDVRSRDQREDRKGNGEVKKQGFFEKITTCCVARPAN